MIFFSAAFCCSDSLHLSFRTATFSKEISSSQDLLVFILRKSLQQTFGWPLFLRRRNFLRKNGYRKPEMKIMVSDQKMPRRPLRRWEFLRKTGHPKAKRFFFQGQKKQEGPPGVLGCMGVLGRDPAVPSLARRRRSDDTRTRHDDDDDDDDTHDNDDHNDDNNNDE